MDFTIRIDDGAEAYVPSVKQGDAAVSLDDSALAVHLGDLFDLSVDLAAVDGARVMENPRPEIYLPLGISMAAERLGRDTIAAVTSMDGLVIIDFTQPVEAQKGPPVAGIQTGDQDAERRGTTLSLQHLILSLEEPAAFVRALNQKASGIDTADAG